MQENMNVVTSENNVAESNVATQETTQEAPVETSKGAKLSKKQRKAQRKAKAEKNETSKIRRRAFSTVAVKSKRHVIVTTDKKGAETYACGRIETSRTAKINAVVLAYGAKGVTTKEVIARLDALYGAGAIKCVSNHLRTMLDKGAVTLKEGRYAIKSKAPKSEAPAPVTESEESK